MDAVAPQSRDMRGSETSQQYHWSEGWDICHMTCQASRVILTELVPRLPARERHAWVHQLSRASQAIPQLLAEGYAKRSERCDFQKYVEGAMAETYETVVSLYHCRYLYAAYVDTTLYGRLIDTYDELGRQLFLLCEAQAASTTSDERCDQTSSWAT